MAWLCVSCVYGRGLLRDLDRMPPGAHKPLLTALLSALGGDVGAIAQVRCWLWAGRSMRPCLSLRVRACLGDVPLVHGAVHRDAVLGVPTRDHGRTRRVGQNTGALQVNPRRRMMSVCSSLSLSLSLCVCVCVWFSNMGDATQWGPPEDLLGYLISRIEHVVSEPGGGRERPCVCQLLTWSLSLSLSLYVPVCASIHHDVRLPVTGRSVRLSSAGCVEGAVPDAPRLHPALRHRHPFPRQKTQ